MVASSLVTCALVTFNSEQVILTCLQSLRLQLEDRQILIYDNNSKDATRRQIQAVSADIRLVQGGVNIGFGRAINALRPHVETPFLLLLNPDALLQPGAILELIEVARQVADAAVLGAVQLTPEGGFVGPEPSPDRYREVDCIFGAAMMLRLDCFPVNAPLFDPRFWMYYEDTDLCSSAIKRGYKVVLANKAVVLHKPGSSSQLTSEAETLAIKRRQYLEYLISGHVYAYKHTGRARMLARAAAWAPMCYVRYLFLILYADPARYLMYQRSLAYVLFCRRIFG
jgi:N-acetylglucosaminyl-diphospho-decaprenol L-rhamnosyltransferase